MKIKVIKNAYYISEDLTNIGMVDQDTFESSFSHVLVVDDVWENIDGSELFVCIEGNWIGEESDGWWDYEGFEYYFEVI